MKREEGGENFVMRNTILRISTTCQWDDQIKDDEMDGACNMHEQ
jgi:hypothetical protein